MWGDVGRCREMRPSTMARFAGDMGRYSEMWGDVGRRGEIRPRTMARSAGDIGRCGEMCGDEGRCMEIRPRTRARSAREQSLPWWSEAAVQLALRASRPHAFGPLGGTVRSHLIRVRARARVRARVRARARAWVQARVRARVRARARARGRARARVRVGDLAVAPWRSALGAECLVEVEVAGLCEVLVAAACKTWSFIGTTTTGSSLVHCELYWVRLQEDAERYREM